MLCAIPLSLLCEYFLFIHVWSQQHFSSGTGYTLNWSFHTISGRPPIQAELNKHRKLFALLWI